MFREELDKRNKIIQEAKAKEDDYANYKFGVIDKHKKRKHKRRKGQR